MSKRSLQQEELDDLSLDGKELHGALDSLEWVNRRLGNQRQAINAIMDLLPPGKKVSITDLGCGGGDMALALALKLKSKGIDYQITGIDGNNNTLDYARKRCAGHPDIHFIQADILQPGFKIEPCDILFSSHFIYHFKEEGLVTFLKQNLQQIRVAMLFSELRRSRLAYALFRVFGKIFPLSSLARRDGLLAIRRSFSIPEWKSLLANARIAHHRIRRYAFFRIQVIIYPERP